MLACCVHTITQCNKDPRCENVATWDNSILFPSHLQLWNNAALYEWATVRKVSRMAQKRPKLEYSASLSEVKVQASAFSFLTFSPCQVCTESLWCCCRNDRRTLKTPRHPQWETESKCTVQHHRPCENLHRLWYFQSTRRSSPHLGNELTRG